jgi:hypothetical protein
MLPTPVFKKIEARAAMWHGLQITGKFSIPVWLVSDIRFQKAGAY